MVLGDRGYQGARGTVRVPHRGRNLPRWTQGLQHRRRPPARIRRTRRGHHQDWRLLRKIRACPQRGTALVTAVSLWNRHTIMKLETFIGRPSLGSAEKDRKVLFSLLESFETHLVALGPPRS